jgi:hypothetical protein
VRIGHDQALSANLTVSCPSCLTRQIYYTAALAGSLLPGGRIDPPLLMTLDEVTQICPVPSRLADSGITTILDRLPRPPPGWLRCTRSGGSSRPPWTS